MQSLSRAVSSLAAITVLALAGVATPSAHAAAAGTGYAALGDSYSSGVGAGAYIDGSGDCKRSNNAYPVLWNKAHPAADFAFAACSGATTGDVLANQLSVLNDTTSLVTISIGGNDVGFPDIIKTCVLGGDKECADAVAKGETYARDTLPAALDDTYARIREHAPSADLVVLGYPRLFELGGCFLGLSESKRKVLNGASDTLTGIISGRAAAAGGRFADVRDEFAGHGVCASDAWLHGVTLPVGDSYHPTDAGHSKGYLPALTETAGRVRAGA